MHEQKPRNLPWLDRLAVRIPGYGGYLERGNRRADDRVFREAVADRLHSARPKLEQAIRQCLDRGALTEINSLERIAQHLDRLAERVRSAGSGSDDFYMLGHLPADKADPLQALDYALFDRADKVLAEFDAPDHDHDCLVRVEADLNDFERKLEERSLLLRGMRS
jgi:hypothetical protein